MKASLEMPSSDISALVDRIYEAAFIPELWPSVIERLAIRIEGVGGALFSVNEYGTKWVASDSCREQMRALSEDGWMQTNIRAQRLAATDYMGFVTDHDLCSDEEIESAPIFRDFLRPRGLGWGTGTRIPAANGDLFIFSLDRSFEQGPVPRRSVEFMDSIRPHIARSAMLAGRLWMERMQGSVSGLNALGIPAAVIRNNGRVLVANTLFGALNRQILTRAFDHIAIADAGANALLKDALALMSAEGHPGTRSIPVPASIDQEPFILHVVPIRREANDLFVSAAAMLVVVPLATRFLPSKALVQSLYDLTPAEARVAAALIEGNSVSDIAIRHKVSRETVRSQVKQVLAKTGTSRQAEMVARFAVLGAILP